jgi:hypothetical protein
MRQRQAAFKTSASDERKFVLELPATSRARPVALVAWVSESAEYRD